MHLGLVGAWRLMLVCRAARAGAKDYLNTLPGFILLGGFAVGRSYGTLDDVWRLNLATLCWEVMPDLLCRRSEHACCAVRDTLIVLGGVGNVHTEERVDHNILKVEMLSEGTFTKLPPLSCRGNALRGGITCASAVAVEESASVAGQVLLLGGYTDDGGVSTVYLVDLATGVCTPQPNLLQVRYQFAAARLPTGRVVCAGGESGLFMASSSAEVLEPPEQEALDRSWTWRDLPAMSVQRVGCRGCVLSDGRFFVVGGRDGDDDSMTSCEALTIGEDGGWEQLSPMHDQRSEFACAAVAKCVIVAGGGLCTTVEVFDEGLGLWLRLPCDLPRHYQVGWMGCALL